MNLQTPAPTIDLGTVKERQHAAWGSGDYARIGTTLQIVGETLCEAADVRSNHRVPMSPPVTAMPRLPQRVVSLMSYRPTTLRRCSIAAASVPRPSDFRSRFSEPMRQIFPSRRGDSMWFSRPSE